MAPQLQIILDIGTGQDIQNKKKSIMDAVDIQSLSSVCLNDEILLDIQTREILDLIDRKLPPQYRRDYLRLQQNAPLSKTRKIEIQRVLQEIIDQGEEYNENSFLHNEIPEEDFLERKREDFPWRNVPLSRRMPRLCLPPK